MSDHSQHDFTKISVGIELIEDDSSRLKRQVTVYSCACGAQEKLYRDSGLPEDLPEKFSVQIEEASLL